MGDHEGSNYSYPPPPGISSPPGFAPNAYPPNTYPPSNTVVVTGGPAFIPPFGPAPQTVTCPYCLHCVTTQVKSTVTTKTHLCALILCLCLCWPCVCCPYCCNTCQGKSHYCPHCNALLGTYVS